MVLMRTSNNTGRAVAAGSSDRHTQHSTSSTAFPAPRRHGDEQINTCFSLLAPDLLFSDCLGGAEKGRSSGERFLAVLTAWWPCWEGAWRGLSTGAFFSVPWASPSFLIISLFALGKTGAGGTADGRRGVGCIPAFSLKRNLTQKDVHICKCS